MISTTRQWTIFGLNASIVTTTWDRRRNHMRYRLRAVLLAFLALATISVLAAEPAKVKPVINPPPTAQDWAALAKLPDWSGVWNPKITDQDAQVKTNPPPRTPKAAAQIAYMFAEEKAGRPPPLFVNCLPEGMPSWMLITHNAMEFLLTPGRVTILGESDGNRIRRIYTDGRPHPADPDPTFHGHSIGRVRTAVGIDSTYSVAVGFTENR